jgi:hypothetical protein
MFCMCDFFVAGRETCKKFGSLELFIELVRYRLTVQSCVPRWEVCVITICFPTSAHCIGIGEATKFYCSHTHTHARTHTHTHTQQQQQQQKWQNVFASLTFSHSTIRMCTPCKVYNWVCGCRTGHPHAFSCSSASWWQVHRALHGGSNV